MTSSVVGWMIGLKGVAAPEVPGQASARGTWEEGELMTEDLKNARPFAESRVLTSMYGTEERFQAMVADELASLETSELILDFLKNKSIELGKEAGGKALQWVSAELLKAFGLGGDTSDLEQIKDLLNQVLNNQKLILSKLEELLLEVDFQHLITRGYDSVQRITNAYQALQNLSTITDVEERQKEAVTFRTGILDLNQGATLNLQTISDVLLGKDTLGQSGALINLFADKWFPVYMAKQFAAGVPLSTYGGQLNDWLHGLFIIQYMGLAELANARIASGEFQQLQKDIDLTTQRMAAQQAMLNDAIPDWTRTLPNSLFDGRWYVVKARDLMSGRIDTTNVLYGSPAAGSYLDYSVQFRSRHANNGDEEWGFVKTGQNDTFVMVERSRPNYVKLDKEPQGTSVKVGNAGMPGPLGGPNAKMRLVMGRTNDPAVKPDAKRRDLYVPLIAFIDTGNYLAYIRGGSNLVFPGPQDKAVRVEIAYAGH
jgi:hypothetical protein